MAELYSRIEDWLRPHQWIVSLALAGVIAVSLWALLAGDPVQRTAWLVWALSP